MTLLLWGPGVRVQAPSTEFKESCNGAKHLDDVNYSTIASRQCMIHNMNTRQDMNNSPPPQHWNKPTGTVFIMDLLRALAAKSPPNWNMKGLICVEQL